MYECAECIGNGKMHGVRGDHVWINGKLHKTPVCGTCHGDGVTKVLYERNTPLTAVEVLRAIANRKQKAAQ